MFIDPLESRQMLAGDGLGSASVKLSKTGTLFITATSVRDTITVNSVADTANGSFDNKLSIVVSITSKYTSNRVDVLASFPQGDVKRIDISSGGGNDSVVANTGIKGRTVIHGGKGNDRLETTGKSNSLFGDSGDDVLTSNTSVSSMNFGAENVDPDQSAERAVPMSYNLLSGGDGNDVFRSRGGNDSIVGGTGNDGFEPLEAGIVTTIGTSLPNINYPSGTVFGTSRVALDSIELAVQEPSNQADVKAYLVGG